MSIYEWDPENPNSDFYSVYDKYNKGELTLSQAVELLTGSPEVSWYDVISHLTGGDTRV